MKGVNLILIVIEVALCLHTIPCLRYFLESKGWSFYRPFNFIFIFLTDLLKIVKK